MSSKVFPHFLKFFPHAQGGRFPYKKQPHLDHGIEGTESHTIRQVCIQILNLLKARDSGDENSPRVNSSRDVEKAPWMRVKPPGETHICVT